MLGLQQVFYFKDIKIYSHTMKEIDACYTTLQQQKDLKVKNNPHKPYLMFGSRMFSINVHVCISVGLSVHSHTHQFIHPSVICKVSGFPFLYKSAPLFQWNKLQVMVLLSLSLEFFEFAAIFGIFLLFSAPWGAVLLLMPVTVLNSLP